MCHLRDPCQRHIPMLLIRKYSPGFKLGINYSASVSSEELWRSRTEGVIGRCYRVMQSLRLRNEIDLSLGVSGQVFFIIFRIFLIYMILAMYSKSSGEMI